MYLIDYKVVIRVDSENLVTAEAILVSRHNLQGLKVIYMEV